MDKTKIDYTKLTPELQDKIKQWESKKPENQQLQILSDIAMMLQEVINVSDDTQKNTKDSLKAIGAVLVDAREHLMAISKKESPEIPDYSKPLIAAIEKLSQDIDKAVSKIEVKPEVKVPEIKIPDIKVPDVVVPEVDLKPIVEALKKDVTKAFKEAIKAIPQTELPEYPDYSDKFEGMISWLESIDTASRMKPVFPNNLATTTKQDAIITAIEGISSSGGLTDAELRATPVPVSGTVTANLGTLNGAATAANQQTDALTDTELRATPVPVSGTVTATPTGTQNVDVTANTIGLATAANQLPDGHNVTVDNGIGAAAVPIQDGGNSITVDGTVAATQSGTWTEANSAAIKTAVETIDNAISGSEMQVDVVGALPAGTNAIGKLAANSGVDIGDVDVTSSVSSTLDHGSNLDIDTTAEQITSTSFAAKFGVTVKSAVDNTATVYIGNSDVTDGDTAATDGFPLEPGESITLPVTNSNLLYAIAASANQKVFWIGV